MATSLERRQSRQRLLVALSVTLGILLGVGGFTFRYAEGLSYFSTDPRACVNCHIMRPQYDGWQKSSHHTVAVCIDCHLPHSFFEKYLSKAENGWRHGKLFTTQRFHEPIELTPPASRILESNCVRCHEALVAGMRGHGGDGLPCLHCHANVGHGERAALGGPLSREEPRR